MELINTCMECNYEWEENNPIACRHCGSGDFYTETEYDYMDVSIEDCIDMWQDRFIAECDADLHKVKYSKED